MGNWTEKEVEALVQGGIFRNPGHKARLRKQLFENLAMEYFPLITMT